MKSLMKFVAGIIGTALVMLFALMILAQRTGAEGMSLSLPASEFATTPKHGLVVSFDQQVASFEVYYDDARRVALAATID